MDSKFVIITPSQEYVTLNCGDVYFKIQFVEENENRNNLSSN